MYNIIEDKISQIYLQRGTLYTTFKLQHLSQSLLITLTYKKNTQYNPYPFHIKFRIEITKTYPCTPPEVLCYTTFCYPSLCDHRDLLYSILTHNWIDVIEKKSKLSEPIEEIVKKIPDFLYKIKENEENYILVYFGIYNIDRLYDINDFLVNTKICLYKTYHISSKNNTKIKLRYMLVTDVYVLLFDVINDQKRNLGKLVFIGDIRQISLLSKHDHKFNSGSSSNSSSNDNHYYYNNYESYNSYNKGRRDDRYNVHSVSNFNSAMNGSVNSSNSHQQGKFGKFGTYYDYGYGYSGYKGGKGGKYMGYEYY